MKRTLSLLFFLLFFAHQGIFAQQDSTLMKSIYFGGGSYYIDYVQVEELKEFIDGIDKLEEFEVVVFSHTDNIGGKEYNKWLSEMRGKAVIEELYNIDVQKEQIKVKDLGQENPLYRNSSYMGRHMNRRVDIILVPIMM